MNINLSIVALTFVTLFVFCSLGMNGDDDE